MILCTALYFAGFTFLFLVNLLTSWTQFSVRQYSVCGGKRGAVAMDNGPNIVLFHLLLLCFNQFVIRVKIAEKVDSIIILSLYFITCTRSDDSEQQQHQHHFYGFYSHTGIVSSPVTGRRISYFQIIIALSHTNTHTQNIGLLCRLLSAHKQWIDWGWGGGGDTGIK